MRLIVREYTIATQVSQNFVHPGRKPDVVHLAPWRYF